MKFSKFFQDFMTGFVGSKDSDPTVGSYIQFGRLKKVLGMVDDNNKIVYEKLTDEEAEVAKSCEDAISLFAKLLELQLINADRQYCQMAQQLPRRLQASFKLSMSSSADDPTATINGAGIFTLNTQSRSTAKYTGLNQISFGEPDTNTPRQRSSSLDSVAGSASSPTKSPSRPVTQSSRPLLTGTDTPELNETNQSNNITLEIPSSDLPILHPKDENQKPIEQDKPKTSYSSAPETTDGEKLVHYLEPMGDLFVMLADETMKMGNFAYMNFTACKKIIKKLQRIPDDMKTRLEDWEYNHRSTLSQQPVSSPLPLPPLPSRGLEQPTNPSPTTDPSQQSPKSMSPASLSPAFPTNPKSETPPLTRQTIAEVSSRIALVLPAIQLKFQNSHFCRDQGYVKTMLTTLMPGLATQASHQLLAAAREGDMELVRKLYLLQGADINYQSPSDGKTAVHIAASCAHDKIVELLIGFKANVNAIDMNGTTPLAAALVDDSSPSLICAAIIRAAGGTLSLPVSSDLLHDMTMHAIGASSRGDLPRLRKLWAAGVPLFDDQTTALHAACESGNVDSVRFLLEVRGVEIARKNRHGKTPLEVVALDSDEELVKLLLTANATVLQPSNSINSERGNQGERGSLITPGQSPTQAAAQALPWMDPLGHLLGPVPVQVSHRPNLRRADATHSPRVFGKKRDESSDEDDIPRPAFKRLGASQDLDSAHPILKWLERVYRENRENIKYILLPDWMRHYDWKNDLKDDAVAGISLSGMFIPGTMALATLVGIPAIYGIYSGVLSAIVYAWFGTSKHLAVGPLSVVSLLVGDALNNITGGPDVHNVALFAVEVGIIFIILGIVKAGFLAQFLSGPALAGFTTAAAILTAAAQTNSLLGTKLEGKNSLLIQEVIRRNLVVINHTHWPTLLLSIWAIASIYYMRKKLPGKLAMMSSLMVMIASMLLSTIFQFSELGLKVVGTVQRGLPKFTKPETDSAATALALLPSAAFVGIVGFIESVAAGKRQAQKFGYKIDNDRELIVLGMANLAIPLTGGLPVFGSLSASAANADLGGKSPMVLIIRSASLVLVLVALTTIFAPLPKAVLAVILLMAVVGMIDFSAVPKLWQTSKSDMCVWLCACVLTLFMGVQVGMATAALLSLLVFIGRTSMPKVIVMAREIGSMHFVPIELDTDKPKNGLLSSWLHNNKPDKAAPNTAVDRKGVLVLSFQAPLWYANCELLRDKALGVLQLPKVHSIIVDMTAVSFVDTTAIDTLKDLKSFVQKMSGKSVVFSGVNPRVAKVLVDNRLEVCFSGNHPNWRDPQVTIAAPSDSSAVFADSIYEALRRSNICWAAHKRNIAVAMRAKNSRKAIPSKISGNIEP